MKSAFFPNNNLRLSIFNEENKNYLIFKQKLS